MIQRFGADRVTVIPVEGDACPLLLVEIDARTKVKVLMTDGLSDYKMPVPEKEIGREYNELYFCLPSYWDVEDTNNPRMNWVFPWIQRLVAYVRTNETWFGHGHTMPCGKEKQPLSETMKQNYFMLCHPLLLEEELSPMEIDGKTIHFLAIIPIFENEFTYKMGKGTKKFLERFIRSGNTENLDDFRVPSKLSRISFLRPQ